MNSYITRIRMLLLTCLMAVMLPAISIAAPDRCLS